MQGIDGTLVHAFQQQETNFAFIQRRRFHIGAVSLSRFCQGALKCEARYGTINTVSNIKGNPGNERDAADVGGLPG